MENHERRVRFIGQQGAEDLYRNIDTGAVYARQECDDEYVRWLTTCKWQGGYEADCPMKEGIVLHAVDRSGKMLFRESIIKVDGYMYTVAEKIGPFSGEDINAMAEDIEKRFTLVPYEVWKKWLMAEAEAAGFTGYSDNWLYNAEYEGLEKIARMDFLGVTVYATKQRAKHKVCGKTWTDYEIRTADLCDCVAICGYELDK